MPKTKKKQESVIERVWKIAAVVLMLLLLVDGAIAVIVTTWGGSNTQQDTGAITITPNENGALIVPTADLTENFQEVDYGGAHSLIFWRDEDGTIYTAFNACQECYAQGNARYTYQDGTLRCQACGNQIDVQAMRTATWGGCQPLAIPVSYRADTETEIIFPAKLLTYSDMMFQAWDGGDFSSTLENYAA